MQYVLYLKLRILSFIIPVQTNSDASFPCPISSSDIRVGTFGRIPAGENKLTVAEIGRWDLICTVHWRPLHATAVPYCHNLGQPLLPSDFSSTLLPLKRTFSSDCSIFPL